jgi:nucleoside-triphosphatase THEP1
MSVRGGIGKEKMKNKQFKWPLFRPDQFSYEENQTSNLFLITGDSGVGKTTCCQQWGDSARAEGRRVGGLLSLPVMTGPQKTAIDLVNLATGERRPLAKLRQRSVNGEGISTGKWLFDTAILAWGNAVLGRVTAVDLLIIDELGPLEFEQGQGLQAAFELIAAGNYRMAGVVIRPSLLQQAQQCWPEAQTISLSQQDADHHD